MIERVQRKWEKRKPSGQLVNVLLETISEVLKKEKKWPGWVWKL
ncbi:hypothetical protein GCM10011571_26600 [Marinithermofilum abyssi]|uniref:Uncharacterized protein n=1 Tax=Marinithermofilum abyssi TaxID=1571185 RepID=A0A8J2VIF9_9BACL|nr:hypothetical protein GCM10011571_26600 [Marinithermofilum abyssi]